MTNAISKTNAIESRAVEALYAKGTALRVIALWGAWAPLVERAYKHGNDAEQWSGKGTVARPLRGIWEATMQVNESGKMLQTAPARAFRELAAHISVAQQAKGRDKSADGVEVFMSECETIVTLALTPNRAAPKKENEAEKATRKLDEAIAVVQKAIANHLLSEAQAQILASALANANANTKAPTKAASTSKAASASKAASTPVPA